VKPKNSNVSGRAEPPLLALLGGKPPAADQARLLGIEPQTKLGQTLRQVPLEPLGVRAMLKPNDGVVGVPDDEHVTAGVPRSPLLGPEIEDVVQVDVREQRRNSRPLRRPVFACRPRPVFDHSCPEPFLDQAQDPLVRDPVLEELQQPAMIKAGEEVADVRVEHPVHLLAFGSDHERIQRIVRATRGPKPVREAEEVRLVDGVQHLNGRPLDDLVLQRGDPERPQPPVRLRDVHPA
jgi:hypothetical protein